MQITSPRGNFIEKIVRDGQGRLARVTVCVYEEHGRAKARLLHVEYLTAHPAIQNKTLAICGICQEQAVHADIVFSCKIVSPYFNLNTLYTSGSKPRAPTF